MAPTEDSWLFVNDLAIADGKVLAATNEGLMYSSDGGHNWSAAVEGKAVYATIDPNAVPEPSTWALLVLGVIALFLRKRVRS